MSAFDNRYARTGAVTAAALAALLLAGCGAGSDSGDAAKTPATAASGTTGTAGAFNDADVAFAQAMIPHHQQALEMAALADGRAEDAGIKKIVADVEKAQDPEIRTMRSWLKAWGKPEAPEGAGASGGSGGHGGHGGGDAGAGDGGAMAGMMSEQDMKELAALKGKAFDRKFAELMIAHHEGAVEMAETERKNGRDATARKLADDVVRTQSAEITELKKILGRL
ncbi:DUF305 domain-containing protein [Streptomyces sp. NPDC047981]|uniref:DUF305 domain-containing protein n=1 Tax=Streptomyces sp. NPDC047981 TaxID=3154610 RepID=UPI003423F965